MTAGGRQAQMGESPDQVTRTGGQRPGQRPCPQSPGPPAGRQLCPGELRAPCTSPNRRLCSDARLPSQLMTQGSGAPSPSSFRPGGPDPPALPPSDPGVQAPIPSPLRPGVQAISPSPLRPGGPDLQPRLPQTRGSRPLAPPPSRTLPLPSVPSRLAERRCHVSRTCVSALWGHVRCLWTSERSLLLSKTLVDAR